MTQQNQNNPTNRWQNAAPYWDKYRSLITQIFAPLTAALIEAARIAPGQNVLDIGGGSGEPSLTLSSVVGADGAVMFSDPAPAMVSAARGEAEKRALTNIRFTQCSGDELPFPDNTFDAAVGRFCAMFFADPLQASREALRVVRPSGRIAFAVWGFQEANPFLSSIVETVEQFVPETAEEASAPDPCRFAAPGDLAGILQTAGAAGVTERPLEFRIQAPISFDEFWRVRTEMSDTLRAKVAQLSAAELARVKEAVAEATSANFASGTMDFPAQTLIVTGEVPKTRD